MIESPAALSASWQLVIGGGDGGIPQHPACAHDTLLPAQ